MTDSTKTPDSHQYGSTREEDELDLLEQSKETNLEFHVTARELSQLSQERTRTALVHTLEAATALETLLPRKKLHF